MNMIDTIGASSTRCFISQSEFNVRLAFDILERRNNGSRISIAQLIIFVKDAYGITNLVVADVLCSVIMDDVKHNRNHIHLVITKSSVGSNPVFHELIELLLFN